MSHGPEHHMEHAEHAVHASHDAFDRRVTMSIAIVAAVLACVTMLGHRAHHDTLRLQGDAIGLQAEASVEKNKASDQWAYYQAQKGRYHQFKALASLLSIVATSPGT